ATAIVAPTGGSPRSPQDASVSGVGPSRAQSPHELAGPVPVHSSQTVSAWSSVREPSPAVFVRYAVSPVPENIVLLTTGSLMTGGLTERLWSCSVESPSLIESSFDGIAESICLQRASCCAAVGPVAGGTGSRNPRESHQDERSTSSPLERMTPPSPDSMN